jgi:cellulose synthase/poly-beta-1,6-N-acetylglucosamine synthase-like glycosyltransferase
MPVFFRLVQALDWFIALAWLLRVMVWRRMLRRVPDLVHSSYAGTLPRLSVIVPARNEAPNIAATLRSLLAAEGV